MQSWVDEADPETDRVHGYVNTNGAVTGTMTHSKPNLAQVPADTHRMAKNADSVGLLETATNL